MSSLILRPYASGKLSAMFAAMVFEFVDWNHAKFTTAAGERTIATAIVSPRARPRPSMEAEMMPGRPNGRTAVWIISQRVAPRASAASSCSFGVCRKTSRQSAVTIGRIMTARTTATVKIVRPVPETGPAKSGNQPNVSVRNS